MQNAASIQGRSPTDLAEPVHPGVRIGHVHLKVADLDRALSFYCGVLGFELTQRYGADAAFVSAGGYHHHIGLNTWESRGGPPPPRGTTGLFHAAILYPTRAALAEALTRVMRAGIPLDGASDHGVSEALYLRDPDENGLELYWDRPQEMWPRAADGSLAMFTRRLDIEDLLAAGRTQAEASPGQSDRGHLEARLDAALEETFPASDPISIQIDQDRPRGSDPGPMSG
jgi:catechol 2,3-dioxygenase